MKKLIWGALLSLCLLNACNKDTDFGIQKTALSSNTTFTTMIQQLVSDGLYKNSDNILVFADMDAFADALDLIDTTGEILMERDSTVDFDDYLSAVASSFNFYSLHQQIEYNIRDLEEADELFDYNDPDNHFIVSNYMRTFLTPYCEVVIGDVLFVFRDGFTLGIMNYDNATLSEIRALYNSNSDEIAYYYLCNSNPKVYLVSPDTLTMNVDFSVRQPNFSLLEYQFTNFTGCEEYQNISYLWDFGDGTTSTSVSPTHLYSTTGTKEVTLTASFEGISKSYTRKIYVENKGCWVDFNYTHDNTGVYHFTVNGYVKENDYPSYYLINFGDGTDTTIYSSDTKIDFKHKYSSYYYNQDVIVTVTLYTQAGEFTSTQRCFNVSHKNCRMICWAHTNGSSENPHYHFYDNYYIKTVIGVSNTLYFHRIHTKSVFLKKNNNNSYVRVKGNQLSTSYYGNVYFLSDNTPDNQCGDATFVNFGKTKNNRKYVELDRGVGRSFSVSYHSLHSILAASHGGQNSGSHYGAAVCN